MTVDVGHAVSVMQERSNGAFFLSHLISDFVEQSKRKIPDQRRATSSRARMCGGEGISRRVIPPRLRQHKQDYQPARQYQVAATVSATVSDDAPGSPGPTLEGSSVQ